MRATPACFLLPLLASACGLAAQYQPSLAATTREEHQAVDEAKACIDLPAYPKLATQLLEGASNARLAETAAGGNVDPREEPSNIYVELAKLDEKIREQEPHGCLTYRTHPVFVSSGQTTFDIEWSYQQRREIVRQAGVIARKEAETKRREQVADIAKSQGYRKVIFDTGLLRTISALVAGEIRLEQAQGVVIELEPVDSAFKALQVVGRGQVIYATDKSDHVVMLKNYKGTVFEGSTLDTLDNYCVVITGLTSYKTLIGSRQAVVIETAW